MIAMNRDDDRQKDAPVKPTRILCYSGYKGEETPRTIILDDKEITVEKILARKRIRDAATGRMSEVFTCTTDRGTVKIARHEGGEWTVAFL